MADNELEFKGKFGLPEFGGFAAKIEGRWKRTWSSRSETLLKAAAAEAGLQPAELGEVLSRDEAEPQRDVLSRVLNRATEVQDGEYVSALGRLVASALDAARVDEIGYATAQVVKLEPLELRALWGSASYLHLDEHGEWARAKDGPTPNVVRRGSTNAQRLAKRERISLAAAVATLGTLTSAGFLTEEQVATREEHIDTGTTGPRIRTGGVTKIPIEFAERTSSRAKWQLTTWGLEVVRITRPGLLSTDEIEARTNKTDGSR